MFIRNHTTQNCTNDEFINIMNDLSLDASFIPNPRGTAEDLVKIIKGITMAFNVDEKLKVYMDYVTDKASNNVKFGHLDLKKIILGCDVHALHHLNLITTDAVNKNSSTITPVKRCKCKAIIKAVQPLYDDAPRFANRTQAKKEGLIENLDEVNNIIDFDGRYPVTSVSVENVRKQDEERSNC